MLKKIWDLWKEIGEHIGNFMSTIILSIFYLLIITPFAIGYKIFGKHFFKFDKEYPTYWKPRQIKDATIENYLKQY